MTGAPRPGWLRRLRAADPTPDGELLRRFLARADQDAFELLIHRHAPAVLRVCRAVARDPHLAEDVAQAVFLVLARKAGTLAGVRSVSAWLVRVAYRAARRARARASARSLAPLAAAAAVAGWDPDPAAAAEAADRAAAVLEEVHRLPERYHAPVVLCYLHGLSNAEAARRLGCPVGTVAGRLARARDLLRTRLARRGVAAPAALAAALGGPAAVPADFVPAVVHAVTAGAAPAVTQLTREVIHAMTATKRRLTAAAAAAVLGLAAAAMTAATHAGDDPKPPPATKPADPPKDEKAAAKREFIVYGVVLGADGKTPMEGIEVWASAGMGTLEPTGKTTTDKDGTFRLTFGPGIAMRKGELYAVGIVHASKPGWTGWAWGWPAQFILTDTPLTKEQKKEHPKYTNLTPGVPSKLIFHMSRAAAVKVRLLGADEKPMANAKLWMTSDRMPPGGSVVAQGKTDEHGVFTATQIPRDLYRLVLGSKDFPKDLILGEIDFRDAAEYVVDVTVYEWTPTSRHVKFKYTRGKDLKP